LYELSLSPQILESSDDIMKQLNDLDKLITESMITSEKSTCCLKDRVLWSPEIEQANFICQYWCVLFRSKIPNIDASKQIDSILDKLDEEFKLSIIDNNIAIHSALKLCLQKHSDLCKEHQQQENHPQRKVDDYNERDDTIEILNIKKLMRRERRRQDHAYIRKIQKNNRSKGISIIEIPDINNPQ
jgi:hypothetical protein